MSNFKKALGFIALSIAIFIGIVDGTIVNIALPDITTYFHKTLSDTSWISTIYMLSVSVFMITASKLADIFGRKKIMLLGLTLFGVSSALCGFSHSLIVLIAMRFIQGIGGAIITPVVVPMGIEILGKENLHPVAAAIGAISGLAAASGPPIGGLIIEYFNWQSIFFLNVPFAIIAFIIIALFTNESYDKTISKDVDIIGTILLTAALFLLVFSLLRGNVYGWKSLKIILMFIGSAVSFMLFIAAETKAKSPLIELGLFKEITLTSSCICYMIAGFGIINCGLIFSYFLQNLLGYEALKASFIVMNVSIAIMFSMPLGTILSKKIGAKPINFLGILILGFGTFLLSKVKVDTSKTIMIFDMIICGFGLGFSFQSLVSGIKFLPEEKSGIGSGIINAGRQIGSCIGIALLASMLDMNISTSKNDVKIYAINQINKANIAKPVKKVAIKDMTNMFDDNDSSDADKQKKLKTKMQNDIKNSLTSLSSTDHPTDNATLEKLYDGVASLNDGTIKAKNGQDSLNTGLNTMSYGLDKLQTGDKTLTSGTIALDNGISQTLCGAQTLNYNGSSGINALTSGISSLNNGAQNLLSQFTSSGNPASPTIYDGVTGITNGFQKFNYNLNNYVSAVNNVYYMMIKSNPASPELLKVYRSNLSNTLTAYASSSGNAKVQYGQQLQLLQNLVAMYTAGTDPSVTDETKFEAKLMSMSDQNIIASSKKLEGASNKLSNSSEKLAAQFNDGGNFKDGASKLAAGTSELNQNASKLMNLQNGIAEITNGLSKLKDGSGNLSTGSQNLQTGISSAENGTNRLLSGSDKLVDTDVKMQNGTDKLKRGIGLAAQKNEIQNTINKINSKKNDEFSKAFDKVFLLSTIILIASSFVGLFTDKNVAKKQC